MALNGTTTTQAKTISLIGTSTKHYYKNAQDCPGKKPTTVRSYTAQQKKDMRKTPRGKEFIGAYLLLILLFLSLDEDTKRASSRGT